MRPYRILSYVAGDASIRPGLLANDTVIDVATAVSLGLGEAGDAFRSTLDLFTDWASTSAILDRVAELGSRHMSSPEAAPWIVGGLSDVSLMAPLALPGGIFCAGANYVDHVREMGHEPPDKSQTRPFFFLKSPAHTIVGPNASILLPGNARLIDWEAELAVVIGKPARNVPSSQAREHVAGYTILNDVSARDFAVRPDWPNFKMDWFSHKNFDSATPMGPWITPARFVPDPHNLGIKLWVGDQLRQDSSTSQLIFDIWEQIEFLSSRLTLRPGDIIATGTPAGTARSHGGAYLKAGDRVRIEIESLGVLENPVASIPA